MQKLLMLLMAVILSISLVACGGGDSGEAPPAESSQAEEQVEETGGGAQIGDEIDIAKGKYSVTINELRTANDYEGNPAVVINYTFANKSEETTSAMVATYFEVFQDGIQLENAVFFEGVDNENSMKDIRPDNSIVCETGFVMTSDNELEIEIMGMEDMFSGEKTLIIVPGPNA